jgi:circadian clock protein KaiC
MTTQDRISTGVTGLDTLLGGGLVPGGVYLVMGAPGTGKTTFGNQACFTHVAGGHRAVYVTLLAETHTRMLRNLASMTFFNPEAVGTQIAYVGAYLVLRERRLVGLLALLRRVLSDEKPTLLVLDGLTTATALGEPDSAMKEFVAELQVLSDMSRCTTIVLANMNAANASGAEHSMVDGMIELTLDRTPERAVREIEVLKFRGGDHFLGRHELEISGTGLIVRPRTETLLARRTQLSTATHYRRVPTGIANLDAMLGGGLLASSSTMLLGFSGSGKTMVGVHFLEHGATQGEPGLYFGFYEPASRLVESAEHLGLPMRKHVDGGAIEILWQSPLRHSLDALADKLLDGVQRRQVKRVVIDGIDGFRQGAAFPERTIRFLTSLTAELRARDVTLMLTEETQKVFGPEVEIRVAGLSALVDNIILLEYMDVGAELKRFLSIVKTRGAGHETHVRELVITDQGIELASTSETAHAILGAALRIRRPPGS